MVVFLLWIYVSSIILMYGVEFTAGYARLRRRRPEDMPAAPSPAGVRIVMQWNPQCLIVSPPKHSPYLLQHKDNPVDWYPWGDEAFERARREDKPIFLSIGYSTCHWCHVMEHESFENAARGRGAQPRLRLDQGRSRGAPRRRPRLHDVRAGDDRGGRVAHERVADARRCEPFYGGHLLSADVRWGRPGFVDILAARLPASGATERDKVLAVRRHHRRAAAERCARGRRTGAAVPAPRCSSARRASSPPRSTHGAAASATRRSFRVRASCSSCCASTRGPATAEPRDMALVTLRAMALGGMRDHLGGGFHRYSVDGDWRVPHFEKMLYDQAQLVARLRRSVAGHRRSRATSTWRSTRSSTCARDLTDPDGGFYSAEDADSVPPEQAADPAPHKTEGAFYIWRDAGDRRGARR